MEEIDTCCLYEQAAVVVVVVVVVVVEALRTERRNLREGLASFWNDLVSGD